MTSVLKRLFPPPPERPVIPPGLYHRMNPDAPVSPYRLHLRVEPDGRGLLIVNASTVLHLNETATAYAWHLIQGTPDDEIAAWMASRFRIGRGRARRDGLRIRNQIEALAEGEDQDPVVVMGLDRAEPYRMRPPAPYRLDLALTFRTDDPGGFDPLARRRVDRELSTREWTSILDRAWADGVPHVVFTGGEPTLREDLVELIRHAEGLGQVTGLVVHGHRLADPIRLEALAQAGLDHLLVVVDPGRPASLQGLRDALGSDVFTAAHLTLEDGFTDVGPVLDTLTSLGVRHVSLTARPGGAVRQVLAAAQEALAERQLALVWDLPAPYASTNPVRLEVGGGPETRAWLYVEPDGDVVPTASATDVIGNALRLPIGDLWRRDGEALAARAAD